MAPHCTNWMEVLPSMSEEVFAEKVEDLSCLFSALTPLQLQTRFWGQKYLGLV